MSCIPASHSMNILSHVESQMEDSTGQRRGSRVYQIFPEVDVNEEPDYPKDFLYRRERLPSIVVEPTDYSELERGEVHQSSQCLISDEEGGHTSDHTHGSDGEQPEDMEQGSGARKTSIGPSQSQLSLVRLTPPASPTPPEAAPPCLRS